MLSKRFRARKILRKIEIQQKPRISAFTIVGDDAESLGQYEDKFRITHRATHNHCALHTYSPSLTFSYRPEEIKTPVAWLFGKSESYIIVPIYHCNALGAKGAVL
jgi:hypothetical protein